MSSRRFVLAVVAVLVTAGGCARDTGAPAQPTPTPAPAATLPDPVPHGPIYPDDGLFTGDESPPTSSPGATVGEITVTGIVEAGVEPSCRILRADDREYLLLIEKGNDQTLLIGKQITVVGRAQPGLATTCMQGIPLVVSEIRAG